MRLVHSIKMHEDDYQDLLRAKSRYEVKTRKHFNSMGEYLKEIAELVG